MPDRPNGTGTLRFTGIEGSTTRWERHLVVLPSGRSDVASRRAVTLDPIRLSLLPHMFPQDKSWLPL